MALEYQGAVFLGGLYKKGVAQPKPERPWRIDAEPFAGAGVGDTPNFATEPNMDSWQIGNTPAAGNLQLRWHKFKTGPNKFVLIADKNILANVSWDDLNSRGYTSGKVVAIDGKTYRCRLLTGGNNYRVGSDSYSGGTPTNEWDRIICREDSIPGLPVPEASDLDATLNATDLNSAHNRFWNWLGIYSWAQEPWISNGAYRVYRGYYSARYWGYNSSSTRNPFVGWRPVLEILDSPYKITLDKPIDILADTQMTKIKMDPFINNQSLNFVGIDHEKITFEKKGLGVSSLDLKIEGKDVKLKNIAYAID